MRKNEAGFTLIEVLLAVTLMMVVAASCFNIFSMGIQIWRRSQGQSLAERKAILFLEKAGEELRNMSAIPKQGELGLDSGSFMKPSIEYKGDAREISFPVVFSPQKGSPVFGFGRVSYRWGSGEICRQVETASDLYRKIRGECRPLASGLSTAKFEYFVSRGVSGEFSWVSEWDGKSAPAAVRIHMEFKKDPKNGTPGKIYEKTFQIPVGS